MRQVMFADDDFDIYADFAGPSQNFHHAPGGSQATLRKPCDFYIHDSAVQFREARRC